MISWWTPCHNWFSAAEKVPIYKLLCLNAQISGLHHFKWHLFSVITFTKEICSLPSSIRLFACPWKFASDVYETVQDYGLPLCEEQVKFWGWSVFCLFITTYCLMMSPNYSKSCTVSNMMLTVSTVCELQVQVPCESFCHSVIITH